MVKIAIAGGSGEVGQEVLDVLIATKKHEITILSRKAYTGEKQPGVTWRVVNYDNKQEMVEALSGIHTVLSFVQALSDPEKKAEKSLIDAAIAAGVKRFAPSEWGSSDTVDMPWWTGKQVIRDYLKDVNKNGKVLEYTLFQPGLFLNYLAFPYKTSKHLTPLNTMIDFQNRRAVAVEGYDPVITLTTVQDVAAVVARAVDYEGEWPLIGGIRGNHVAISDVLEVGKKVRGRPFAVESVQIEDLENGKLTTSWALEASHPSVTGEQAAELLKTVLIGTLLSSAKGAWAASEEFNQLFPDYKFVQIEDFLAKIWEDKP